MTRASEPIRPASADDGQQPAHASRIVLAHGGGGQLTDDLLREAILPRLSNHMLDPLGDAAFAQAFGEDRPAITIDSYVVDPWKFPGGDIGRLAVCGTVNDLAVSGARPVALALSLILPEGFARKDLETILDSVATAAAEASVLIATGDTKVIGRSHGDGPLLTTAGLGRADRAHQLGIDRVAPGDLVLLSGSIGEHGLAVMLAREMPEMESVLRSDVAPLAGLTESLLDELDGKIAFMRDPTRSGLAGVAVDIASNSGWRVRLDEDAIPIRSEARHAADMLGLDPLEIANEGKLVAVVRPDAAQAALAIMTRHPIARDAAIIGEVTSERDGICELLTSIGGRRIVQKPYGEQLPRIC